MAGRKSANREPTGMWLPEPFPGVSPFGPGEGAPPPPPRWAWFAAYLGIWGGVLLTYLVPLELYANEQPRPVMSDVNHYSHWEWVGVLSMLVGVGLGVLGALASVIVAFTSSRFRGWAMFGAAVAAVLAFLVLPAFGTLGS